MKTFLTEKHNIPDGATHYFEETENEKFAWWDENKALLLCPGNGGSWESPYGADDISNPIPIPQTNIETPEEKEVEWINGDTVEYHNKHEGEGGILTFVGIHPTHKDHAVLYGKHLNGGYMSAPLSMLSKPETEAERVERERANAIYDMCASADNFTEESNFWAGKFYDLGYRKEGE